MKAILKYKLPKEKNEFYTATKGMDLFLCLWSFHQTLLKQIKECEDDKEIYIIENILKRLNEELEDYNINLDEII